MGICFIAQCTIINHLMGMGASSLKFHACISVDFIFGLSPRKEVSWQQMRAKHWPFRWSTIHPSFNYPGKWLASEAFTAEASAWALCCLKNRSLASFQSTLYRSSVFKTVSLSFGSHMSQELEFEAPDCISRLLLPSFSNLSDPFLTSCFCFIKRSVICGKRVL